MALIAYYLRKLNQKSRNRRANMNTDFTESLQATKQMTKIEKTGVFSRQMAEKEWNNNNNRPAQGPAALEHVDDNDNNNNNDDEDDDDERLRPLFSLFCRSKFEGQQNKFALLCVCCPEVCVPLRCLLCSGSVTDIFCCAGGWAGPAPSNSVVCPPQGIPWTSVALFTLFLLFLGQFVGRIIVYESGEVSRTGKMSCNIVLNVDF
jgi:hypothetical protein